MEKKIIFFIVASVAFAYLGLHFQPFLCNHSSWKPVLLMESKNCRNPRLGLPEMLLPPSAWDLAVVKVQTAPGLTEIVHTSVQVLIFAVFLHSHF